MIKVVILILSIWDIQNAKPLDMPFNLPNVYQGFDSIGDCRTKGIGMAKRVHAHFKSVNIDATVNVSCEWREVPGQKT